MSPTRPSTDPLAWRLVAEAADRFADEAFTIASGPDLSEAEYVERSTRAKALAMLSADLIP